MIRLRGIGLDAPGSGGRVGLLDRLELDILSNEYVVVVGPNGAGKSLLLQLLARLRSPSRGTITYDEPDTLAALVFQRPDDQIVGSTVARDLAFGLENQGLPPAEIRERVGEALIWSGLESVERTPPHLLSEGQKQRLALTSALILRPAILLLDEPTSRLDPPGRRLFLDAVDRVHREVGTAVVHVTHRSEELVRADRVLGLRRGTLAFDGTPAELLGSGMADDLGILWNGLHRMRRALESATPLSEWNDPADLLRELAG